MNTLWFVVNRENYHFKALLKYEYHYYDCNHSGFL